jgi:large subunit ribosomal protein L10
MAKTREQKQAAVEQLTKGFKEAKSVAFADYHGLTVRQVDELRNKMREADVSYVVAKKTLVNRAAKEAGFELDAKQYKGMLGIAFGSEDEIAPARVLGDMSKTTSVQILGGIFEGVLVDQEKMVSLSRLPSKLELLGTVVGTIYAPVSSFVRVLDAIREQREAAEGSPATEAPAEAPKESEKADEAGSVGATLESPKEEPPSAEATGDKEKPATEAEAPAEEPKEDATEKSE